MTKYPRLNREKFNYYGFRHDKVDEKFEGDLTFICTTEISGAVWAVYKAANPNREKGHKDFLLLRVETSLDGKGLSTVVSGRSAEDFERHRYVTGICCPNCKDLVYSMHRHDMHSCACGKCAIDGGRDYARIMDHPETVKIDLLEGKVVETSVQPH